MLTQTVSVKLSNISLIFTIVLIYLHLATCTVIQSEIKYNNLKRLFLNNDKLRLVTATDPTTVA